MLLTGLLVLASLGCNPPQVVKTAGDVTLEHVGNNEALGCVSAAWGRPPEHGDYPAAWKSAATLAGVTREIAIVGHGDRGILCAGMADACWNDYENGQVYAINQEALRRLPGEVMALGGHITSLRLIGCRVGAEVDGFTLVKNLSLMLNAEVSAPMCDVECEDGVVAMAVDCKWRTSAEKGAPPAIEPTAITIPSYDKAQFYVDGQSNTVPLTQVSVVAIELISRTNPESRFVAVDATSRQQAMFAAIGLNRPRRMKGRYLAMRAARITLRVEIETDKSGLKEKTKHLIILNWEHAVDEDDQSVVYDVDRRLKAKVEAF